MTLSIEEIDKIADDMANESKALKHDLFKMCWYMRGGLSFEEAYQLDQESREIIHKIVQSNMEATKESGLPFF